MSKIEINTTQSKEIVNPDNTGEIREKVGYKKPPKEHQFKKGNPGKKPGTKNFDTIFDLAIKEIAASKELKIDDPEQKLMVKGIVEALKGNHNFWKSIAEWRYGKPKESIELEIKPKMVQLDD